MTVLLGLLAGLGVASAQADAPVLTRGGGRQTPRVTEQTPGTLPSNATNTPLPSPSPIQTTSPLSPETVSPSNTVTTTSTGSNGPSSSTDIQDSTTSTSAKPSEKANDQAVHVVQFNTTDSSKPTQATVKTGTLTLHPEKNPVREGFRFDGWTLDGQPFDFQTPILQDITLTAKWAKTTDWTLSPDHGPATGAQLTISPPDR